MLRKGGQLPHKKEPLLPKKKIICEDPIEITIEGTRVVVYHAEKPVDARHKISFKDGTLYLLCQCPEIDWKLIKFQVKGVLKMEEKKKKNA